MRLLKITRMFLIPLVVVFMFTGCSSTNNKQTLQEAIWQHYKNNNRLDVYNKIQKEYDGNEIILWFNENEDHSWFANHIIYWLSGILPDLPNALATGGFLAFIYGLAWWLGITLTGGGILALLSFLGGLAGGIPGIPPAIAGLVFLGISFEMLVKIFSLL